MWLLLDSEGAIDRIVNEGSGELPPGHSWLETDIPADYPFAWCWDAASFAFVATNENRLRVMRSGRDERLTASDWTQLPDSPLSEAKRAEWAAYRQTLRDLPETADPADFEWPAPPTP